MQNPKNKKPSVRLPAPLSLDNYFKPTNHTDETSEPQQAIVTLVPIVTATDRDPPPELPLVQIIQCTHEAIANASNDPRDLHLMKVLIEMNFIFEILSWADGTCCGVGWPPNYHGPRELTDESLLVAYASGRTALEQWHLFARGRTRDGGSLQ